VGIKSCGKWRQLDIAVFEGDAIRWTGKVERYFHLRGPQEEEKMEVVMVAIERIVSILVSMLGNLQPKPILVWFQECTPSKVSTCFDGRRIVYVVYEGIGIILLKE